MYQAAGEGLFTSGRPPTGRRYLIHLSGETLVSKTSSFQRLGTAGLAALAVVGLLSGCASKKKTAATSSTASTAASAAPAATSAAGAAAASAPAAQPSKVVATGGGKFCKEVASAVNDAATKNALSGGGTDSLKQSVQNFKSLEGSVLASAPKEIKSDLVTLFGALDPFYEALQKANYDFTKIDPSIGSTLDTPAVKAATDHVDAYIKGTCGIDTGAGGGTGDSSAAAASASAALASALAKLTASPAG